MTALDALMLKNPELKPKDPETIPEILSDSARLDVWQHRLAEVLAESEEVSADTAHTWVDGRFTVPEIKILYLLLGYMESSIQEARKDLGEARVDLLVAKEAVSAKPFAPDDRAKVAGPVPKRGAKR